MHAHLENRGVANVADIRLRVDRKRSRFPNLELRVRHLSKGLLRRGVVGKRIGQIARVPLTPKAVHHEIHPLDQRITVKLGSEQVIQFEECLLKGGIIVARLNVFAASATVRTDLHERDLVTKEIRQCDPVWLKLRVRHLHPKGDTQAATLRCVKCQIPDRIEIQAAGLFLHIAPIAPDVEHIDKGQAREFLDVLFERFTTLAGRN